MKCFHCSSNKIRLSRIRTSDISKILKWQVPVRCRSCRERFFVTPSIAWRIGRADKAFRRQRRVHRNDRGSAVA